MLKFLSVSFFNSTTGFPCPSSPLLVLFCVSVVFMGSDKYPSENGFDAFLKKHGGSDNASTDCERTVFQFDVQRRSFKEALDRCAGIQSALLLHLDQLESLFFFLINNKQIIWINSQHKIAKLVRD